MQKEYVSVVTAKRSSKRPCQDPGCPWRCRLACPDSE
jgi:hypothetical protein